MSIPYLTDWYKRRTYIYNACKLFDISKVKPEEESQFIESMQTFALSTAEYCVKLAAVNTLVTVGAAATERYAENNTRLATIAYSIALLGAALCTKNIIDGTIFVLDLRRLRNPNTSDKDLSSIGHRYLYINVNHMSAPSTPFPSNPEKVRAQWENNRSFIYKDRIHYIAGFSDIMSGKLNNSSFKFIEE
jgi:hypothetical protein